MRMVNVSSMLSDKYNGNVACQTGQAYSKINRTNEK